MNQACAPTPGDACQDGQLVKFGDVTGAGLTQDAYSRTGQFLHVLHDPVNGIVFPPFGCIDTSPQAGVPATLVFSLDTPVPPSTVSQPSLLGANGADWEATSAADIQGSLSIWLCLQNRGD